MPPASLRKQKPWSKRASGPSYATDEDVPWAPTSPFHHHNEKTTNVDSNQPPAFSSNGFASQENVSAPQSSASFGSVSANTSSVFNSVPQSNTGTFGFNNSAQPQNSLTQQQSLFGQPQSGFGSPSSASLFSPNPAPASHAAPTLFGVSQPAPSMPQDTLMASTSPTNSNKEPQGVDNTNSSLFTPTPGRPSYVFSQAALPQSLDFPAASSTSTPAPKSAPAQPALQPTFSFAPLASSAEKSVSSGEGSFSFGEQNEGPSTRPPPQSTIVTKDHRDTFQFGKTSSSSNLAPNVFAPSPSAASQPALTNSASANIFPSAPAPQTKESSSASDGMVASKAPSTPSQLSTLLTPATKQNNTQTPATTETSFQAPTPSMNMFAQQVPTVAEGGAESQSKASTPWSAFNSSTSNLGSSRGSAQSLSDPPKPRITAAPALSQGTSGSATTTALASPKPINVANDSIDVEALRSLRVECLAIVPEVPDNLWGAQRDEYILAYRLMCLEKGLRTFVSASLGTDAELKQASRYYEMARSVIFQAAGAKRKAGSAQLSMDGSPSKRTNIGGPVTSGPGSSAPLFGFPTASKRKSDSDGDDTSPKKARSEDANYPDASGGSQTSKLFANLTNSAFPNQSHTMSNQPSGSTLTGSAPTVNIFDSGSRAPTANGASLQGLAPTLGSRQTSTSAIQPFKSPNDSGDQSPGSLFKLPNAAGSISLARTSSQLQLTSAPNFMAQFGEQAKKSEQERKQRAKDDDWDPDDETEEEWDERYEGSQKAKRMTQGLSNLPRFSLPFDTNFLSQFGKTAALTAEQEARKAKERRKAENFDSDEETEEQWEQRDAEQQRRLKEERQTMSKSEELKFKAPGISSAFTNPARPSAQPAQDSLSPTPTPNVFEGPSRAGSDVEGSKTGDADNEASDESDREQVSGNGAKTPSTAPPGRSLFDRIEKDESGSPKPVSPHETTKHLFAAPPSSVKANPFASLNKTTNDASTSLLGDHTWKAESPIKFATSTATPSVNVFAPSPSKPSAGDPKSGLAFGSLFGNPTASTNLPSSGNIFGHLATGNTTSQPASNAGVDFGFQSISGSGSLAPKSVLDSATTSRGTSPGATTAEESTGEGGVESASNEPQLDLSTVRAGEEEEDVLFEVKAKAMEFDRPSPQEDKTWLTRGVGDFRLLRNRETKKTRMILRAQPASKVVINTRLQASVTYIRQSDKDFQFVDPKGNALTKWNVRVGKKDDAAKIIELIEANKAN